MGMVGGSVKYYHWQTNADIKGERKGTTEGQLPFLNWPNFHGRLIIWNCLNFEVVLIFIVEALVIFVAVLFYFLDFLHFWLSPF